MSGIGRYSLNLLHGLHEADPGAGRGGLGPVRVWVRPDAPLPEVLRRSTALDLIERNGSPRDASHQWAAGRAVRRLGVKVAHWPDVFAPVASSLGGCRRVVTLHDVIPLVCRGQINRSLKQRFTFAWRAWCRLQTKRAAAVVTVSEYSAGDIHRVLGVPTDKLAVIPNAVPTLTGETSSPDGGANDAARLSGLGVGPRFILNVGRRDPYKNVDGLVRAFAAMRSEHAALGDTQLVVVGQIDPRYPEAEREAHRLGVAASVRFVGYVSDADLAALYRQASLLVMPSRYEGFGLPAVEAMRAGTPVVAGAVASVPEVVGDAAVLVDVGRDEELAAGMARVLRDEGLASGLVTRGLRRAEAFSARRSGEAHLALYDRLARGATLR